MLDNAPPEIALLCLALMLIWAVGLLIVFLRGDKQKNEEE